MSLHDLFTLESAALVAAVSALGGVAAKVWPILHRLARFLDDVQGEPERPGSPARPGWGERLLSIENNQRGLDSRLQRLEDKTERVRAQTENSHSTNLRDDLDRIGEKVADIHRNTSN